MKTFYQWLMEQVDRNDPIGDLANDVQRSDDAPKLFNTFERWSEYISRKTRDFEVLDTLDEAWQEYDPYFEIPTREEENEEDE